MIETRLSRRAIIRIAPRAGSDENVREFLQGLVTNDVQGALPVYAALLSAQGKAMFDFLVWPGGDDALLIDCQADCAQDLAKRLSLYRLRRAIDIELDETRAPHWSASEHEGAVPDPRLAALGWRSIGDANGNPCDEAYRAHRLEHGVPEGQAELGEILWLETNAVELNGVSFAKGCYIGQENTARMNWRQKVNRRLFIVPLEKSEEKRRKIAYPDHGLAVDHLRIADLDPDLVNDLPAWQRAAISD